MNRADAAGMPGAPRPSESSSASAPRTSPTGIRSGRSRSDERTRVRQRRRPPSLVRSATKLGAAHCNSRVSSISTTRSAVLATSASSALTSVVLPVEVPPATSTLRAQLDRKAQQIGLLGLHDADGHIVFEREHRDRRLADRECRRGDDGRDQSLEALARLRQFSRNARRTGMDLCTDMMRDQAHDALAIRGRHPLAGVFESPCEPVDPQAAVGVEHHLDDGRLFQPGRDRRPECGPQHAGATQCGFGSIGLFGHPSPHLLRPPKAIPSWG